MRSTVLLAVATLGLGLNLRAWILLGVQLHTRFGTRPGEHMLLVLLPLLVAAVGRLPVGVLTDRYGARVMLPVVSLISAVSVFGLAMADSLPAAIVAGSGAGLGGAAFVVTAALVCRSLPYGRRGLALGVLSLGSAPLVAVSVLPRMFDPGGRGAALVLGCLLVGYAGLCGLVLRDRLPHPATGAVLPRCAEMVRLAVSTPLTLLYALALGGLVATAMYLPLYLATVFGLGWYTSLGFTGAIVGMAALARLLGGWWTDRRPTPRLLVVCYAVAGVVCLAASLDPQARWLAIVVIGVVAWCDGLASGALLALIGKAARPESAGAVMGVTGAAAGLGALVPPLLLAAANRVSHSYATAWLLLAIGMFGVSVYVRTHGLRVGLGLAVRVEPEPTPTAMTVAVVGGCDAQVGAAAVIACIAELATSDELVVVYGAEEPPPSRPAADTLVTGLRVRLPRYSFVAVRVARYAGTRGRLAAVLGELVDAGSVAIAVTPMADLRRVAAELSSNLHADRVLMISYTLSRGAYLHEVWQRGLAAPNGV